MMIQDIEKKFAQRIFLQHVSGNTKSNMAVQIEGQGRHGNLLLFCDTFNHEQNEVTCLLKCQPTYFALN